MPITGGAGGKFDTDSFPLACTAFVGRSADVQAIADDFTNVWYADGTADDVQINAAITYVNGLGGGKICVGRGVYDISSSITMLSEVHLNFSRDAVLIASNGLDSQVILANNREDFVISGNNTYIDGNSASQGGECHGIAVTGTCTRWFVEGFHIDDCRDVGVFVYHDSLNEAEGRIDRIHASNCGDQGILVDYQVRVKITHIFTDTNGDGDEAGVTISHSEEVILEDLHSDNDGRAIGYWESHYCTATDIYGYDSRSAVVTYDASAAQYGCTYNVLENIVVEDCSVGVVWEVGANHCSLNNFVIENCDGVGLGVNFGDTGECSHINISNGIVYNCGDTSNAEGALIVDSDYVSLSNVTIEEANEHGAYFFDSQYCTISGCTFINNGQRTNNTYDHLFFHSDAQFYGIMIEGCNFVGDGTVTRYGVNLSSAVIRGAVLRDNQYHDLATNPVNDSSSDYDKAGINTVLYEPGVATDTNEDDFTGWNLPDGSDTSFRINFIIPNAYKQIVRASVLVIPGANGNIRWDLTSQVGTVNSGTHFNGGSIAKNNTGVTNNRVEPLDFTSAISGQSRRLVGVTFTRYASEAGDTSEADAVLIGVLIEWV